MSGRGSQRCLGKDGGYPGKKEVFLGGCGALVAGELGGAPGVQGLLGGGVAVGEVGLDCAGAVVDPVGAFVVDYVAHCGVGGGVLEVRRSPGRAWSSMNICGCWLSLR